MTPEQEAELRARLAAARNEVDSPVITASPTVIDIDEPEPRDPDWGALGEGPVERARMSMKDWLHNRYYKGDIDIQPNQELKAHDEEAEKKVQDAVMPYMSYIPNVAVAQRFVDDRTAAQKQAEKLSELTEREKLLLKAKANAERIAAAKAQQQKVTQDRDETVAAGGRGYRVERALYPSDLHRK
jgi:hypothetical protein